MKIAIVGTGNVGAALARAFSRAGHHLVLAVRNAADPKVVTLVRETKAEVKVLPDAAQAADVVVLALPWGAAEGAVKALGGLKGKIVIDCMNPLAMQNGKLGLDRGFSTSGAETLAGSDSRGPHCQDTQPGGCGDDGGQCRPAASPGDVHGGQ